MICLAEYRQWVHASRNRCHIRDIGQDPDYWLPHATSARAHDQNSSVFRAQGRLDALDQPLPHVRHGPAEQEEDADDRQIGLHRRRQREADIMISRSDFRK